MSSSNILQIKKLIRSINLSDVEELVNEVMQLKAGAEIEGLAQRRLKELVPDFKSISADYKGDNE